MTGTEPVSAAACSVCLSTAVSRLTLQTVQGGRFSARLYSLSLFLSVSVCVSYMCPPQAHTGANKHTCVPMHTCTPVHAQHCAHTFVCTRAHTRAHTTHCTCTRAHTPHTHVSTHPLLSAAGSLRSTEPQSVLGGAHGPGPGKEASSAELRTRTPTSFQSFDPLSLF